ncbi:MAG TPA: class I SAM-dependent methyltransferase [Candidatus Cybelea sp.]|nr:class I SAM-dependent methyltransferase [Candidatus Cybelea sp.]
MRGIVETLHDRFVFDRRVRVLAGHLSALIPERARVLDVGCGDGAVDALIVRRRPDIFIQGIDVLLRPGSEIPVERFDGVKIPYGDGSFDLVMFVDVLHHTRNPRALLREAKRVGSVVLVKDHFKSGLWGGAVLRFMDWVGNAHHGVALPYNYWSKPQWLAALADVGLQPAELRCSLGLYPPPASWIFERELHFVGRFNQAEKDGRDPPSSLRHSEDTQEETREDDLESERHTDKSKNHSA